MLCAAAPAFAQSGDTAIAKISAYAGTWKSETEHFNTKFSKARKESTSLRNDCWRSGAYYACHQFVNGKAAALIVYTYNEKNDAYKSYVIPPDGGDAVTGKLLIKGNVWTFPWKDKDSTGKTFYFQVVNVWTGPDTIDYRTEFSADKVHWTVASKGHEYKVQ
ncbi:MAG: hypothetical protein ACYDD2_11460 [Candidatus Acidiferrales bacterium]